MAKANIRIIGRKGNKTCRIIVKEAGIPRYTGVKTGANILVNFGLAGTKQDSFFRRFPSAKRIPTINKHCGYSKLNAVNRAKSEGLSVPESKLSLTRADDKKDWIEKGFSSVGGKGIREARGKNRMATKYYQKFVNNRKYELRVHTFLWTGEEGYKVQKRIGDPKVIAWNFSKGGKFITVNNPKSYRIFKEAMDASTKILKNLGMAFGAVDFIVTDKYELIFLEVNAAPGVSGLSDAIYISAFKKLKELSFKELNKYTR